MSTQGRKKSWEKPKLIVLVRGDPAESLTTYCKRNTASTPASPGARNSGYCFSAASIFACGNCSDRSKS